MQLKSKNSIYNAIFCNYFMENKRILFRNCFIMMKFNDKRTVIFFVSDCPGVIVCALDNQIFYGFIITNEEQKGKQLLFQKTRPPQRQIVDAGYKNAARTTANCITG